MARHLVLALLILLPASMAGAWDRNGHRLSAELAYAYLDDSAINHVLSLLKWHPRYQQDFLSVMPQRVRNGPLAQRQIWLLGQAAYWPDLARSLPDDARDRYNRPDWHFIDGAWLRDKTTIQGNVYINRRPLPTIEGAISTAVTDESDASNIVLALDYNAALLSNATATDSEKAVALCWLLHLIGDLHQPLHGGSMYSIRVQNGDAGGNGIATASGSLHRRWDSALSSGSYRENLVLLQQQLGNLQLDPAFGAESDWTIWLQESREILLSNSVYDTQIRRAVEKADKDNEPIAVINLDEPYLEAMSQIAGRRIAMAGLRLANWVNAYVSEPQAQ